MANNRDDFTKETIEVIASRVGYRCSKPDCRAETRGPHTDIEKRVSVGEAAHITAAASGGPRYDKDLTKEQRKSAENGIWLCRKHARLIDADEGEYTVKLLKEWKMKAEYEQYCRINNKININQKGERCIDVLRSISKGINELNDIYSYLKEYYDKNLSRFGNFVEVNNKIMELWSLYGEDLQTAVIQLISIKNEISSVFLEYKLDISLDLKKYIEEYMKLSSFQYSSDGSVGMYENYYEKLFEMLYKNYDILQNILENINEIIEQQYNSIY